MNKSFINHSRFFLTLLLCLVITMKGSSQPFPVSVTTQVTTPSLPYLEHYVQENPQTLRAVLLLNDDSRNTYDVILNLRISGQGIELRSRLDFFSQPITLNYNIPVILTGFELSELFNPANLDISGIPKNTFLQTGRLPDGIYTLCLEAYDVNRFDERPVSNAGCIVAGITEHEPPTLNTPKDFVHQQNPTILPFNWHPAHQQTFITTYQLQLYEKLVGLTDDQVIYQTAPIFTTETTTPSYIYSAADPFLTPGQEYIWRVQALDLNEQEHFKNNGYSKIARFTYGIPCETPINLNNLITGNNSRLIQWVDPQSAGSYQLRYRRESISFNTTPTVPSTPQNAPQVGVELTSKPNKNGTTISPVNNGGVISGNGNPTSQILPTDTPLFSRQDWIEIANINDLQQTLTSLMPLRYQISVRSKCGSGYSPWSENYVLDNRTPEEVEFLLPPILNQPTQIDYAFFNIEWEYDVEAFYQVEVAYDSLFTTLLDEFDPLTAYDKVALVSGLASGQTYYVRVKAYRGALESDYSNVVDITTSAQPYTFPQLTTLNPLDAGYDGFTARWQGGFNPLGGNYFLQVSRTADFSELLSGYEDIPISPGTYDYRIDHDLVAGPVYYKIKSVLPNEVYTNVIEVPAQTLPSPVALEALDLLPGNFLATWKQLPVADNYELDVARDPYFSDLLPDYQHITTNETSLLITGLDTENQSYYYRVRAKIAGRTSGNSNTIVVSNGMLAVLPEVLPPTGIRRETFRANWRPIPGISTFSLDVATSPDFLMGTVLPDYNNHLVSGTQAIIRNIDFTDTTEYYYRIRAVVGEDYSIYSALTNVEWEGCYFGPQDTEFACGIPADPTLPENLPLIAQLAPGDTIQAGDFLVILNSVSGSGTFSGTGYLAQAIQQVRINMVFDNIKVDEKCRMVDGRMEVTGAGLALISEELAAQINDLVETLGEIETGLEAVSNLLTEVSELLNKSASVGGYLSNGWSLIDGVGPIHKEYPYLSNSVTDSLQQAIDCFTNSANWNNCQQQLAPALQALQNGLVDHFDASQQIQFYAAPSQNYGFDGTSHEAFSENYSQITVADLPYTIAWKSVATGQTDLVRVGPAKGGNLSDNIRFEDQDKNPIPTQVIDGQYYLTVTATTHESVAPIYAVENQADGSVKLAGKLHVITYDPKPTTLVIVPVNGVNFTLDENTLADSLRGVFQSAVVDLQVSIGTPLSVQGFDDELNDEGSGFLRNYTDEMKTIMAALSARPDYDESAYYLFLLPRFANTQLLGYMPKKKQFGFLNHEQLSTDPDAYTKTLAHEFAHGAYVLAHTFEQYPQLDPTDTDNLMGYAATGKRLLKYQWDGMHDPARNWTLFDEDEEGKYTAIGMDGLETYKNNLPGTTEDGTYTFITPAGLPITVPANTTEVAFNTGDEIGIDNHCFTGGFDILPFGTLRYFIANDGKKYVGRINCNEVGQFTRYGYDNNGELEVYRDTFSGQLDLANHKAVVGFPCYGPENGIVFNLGQVNISGVLPPTLNLSVSEIEKIKNKENYLGTGVRKDFAFLTGDDYLNVSQTSTITIEPPYTTESFEFLKRIEGAGACNAAEVMVVFTHAHQIAKYPALFNDCKSEEFTIEPINRLVRVYDEMFQIDNFNLGNGVHADFGTMQLLENSEIASWKGRSTSIYKYYQELFQNRDNFIDNFDESTLADAHELFNLLYYFRDHLCFFEAIPLERRKKILRILSQLDLTESNWYEFGFFSDVDQEQEHLYSVLLQTTPEHDYQEILDLFSAQNYQLFYTVVNKLNDNGSFGLSDGIGYEPFVTHLSKMLLRSRVITQVPFEQTRINEDSIPLYLIEGQLEESALQIIGIDNGEATYSSYVAYNLSGSNKITLKSSKRIPQTSNQGNVDFVGPERRSSGSPFEYVAVKFDHDFKFIAPDGDKQEFTEGQVVMLPYIMVDYIYRRTLSAELQLATRQTLDVFAILSIPLSGGLTGALSATVRFAATVDGGLAAIDLMVFAPDAYEYEVTGYSDLNREVHALWDNVLLGSGVVNMGGFIGQLVDGGFRISLPNLKKLCKNIRSDATDPATTLKELEDKLKSFRKKMIEIPPAQNTALFRSWMATIRELEGNIAALNLNRSLSITDGIDDLTIRISSEDSEMYIISKIDNVEQTIPGGEVIKGINDETVMRLSNITNEPIGGTKLGILENVKYTTRSDETVRAADVEIYKNTDNTIIYRVNNLITNDHIQSLSQRYNLPESVFDGFRSIGNATRLLEDEIVAAINATLSDNLLRAQFFEDILQSRGLSNSFASNLDDFDLDWLIGWKICFNAPSKQLDLIWLKKIAAYPESVKIDNVNPSGISWTNDMQPFQSPTSAVDFWNDVSRNYLYYERGDFIIKYDYDAGKFLVGNKSTNEIIGIHDGSENITKLVYDITLPDLMRKLKRYHGVSGPSAPVINLPFIQSLASDPDRTTTIIGRFVLKSEIGDDIYSSGVMKTVLDELLGVMTLYMGPNVGGFNLLNVSKDFYFGENFWTKFNKPWLDGAIARGDKIVAAADPMDLNNIFRDLKYVPVEELTSPESIAFYLKNLTNKTIIKNMTYYGKEVKLLSESDYLFNIQTKIFNR